MQAVAEEETNYQQWQERRDYIEGAIRNQPGIAVLYAGEKSNPAMGKGHTVYYFEELKNPFETHRGTAIAALGETTVWENRTSEGNQQYLTREMCFALWQSLAPLVLPEIRERPEGFQMWPQFREWAFKVFMHYREGDYVDVERELWRFAQAFNIVGPNSVLPDLSEAEEESREEFEEIVTRKRVDFKADLSWIPPVESGDVLTVTYRYFGDENNENEVEVEFQKNPARLEIGTLLGGSEIAEVEGE